MFTFAAPDRYLSAPLFHLFSSQFTYVRAVIFCISFSVLGGQAADSQIVSDYVRYFLHQHTWVLSPLPPLLYVSWLFYPILSSSLFRSGHIDYNSSSQMSIFCLMTYSSSWCYSVFAEALFLLEVFCFSISFNTEAEIAQSIFMNVFFPPNIQDTVRPACNCEGCCQPRQATSL